MPLTVVNFRHNSILLIFFSIIPKVFNFQCHNLSFCGGCIPPESPTKLYGIQGRNYNMHEHLIGQIHPFLLSKIELIPFIIADLQHKSMRTSRIDRWEPRYAGTEFTNRESALLNSSYRKVVWAFAVKLLSGECQRTSSITRQHWFR